MGKFDKIRYLKLTKARGEHFCNKCGNEINVGNIYYSEKLKNKFLHKLYTKKFCSGCYTKFGQKLLETGACHKVPR